MKGLLFFYLETVIVWWYLVLCGLERNRILAVKRKERATETRFHPPLV